MAKINNDHFIFMKIGNHAGETFDQIFRRKNQEFEKTGNIFWGYGGVACHPTKQVRPFVDMYLEKRDSIYLVMNPVNSASDQAVARAEEYSTDGIEWHKIPENINVLGSKYALILDEIKIQEFELNLNDYEVGIGPSRGKTASDYLKGRTDKACLIKKAEESEGEANSRIIKYTAKLKEPYAVLLR